MRTDLTTAGVTGRPNDDWCESHKAETTLTNVVGTLTPAELCREEGLILINYATGHIFEYDSTFVPVMIFGVVSGAGSMSMPPGSKTGWCRSCYQNSGEELLFSEFVILDAVDFASSSACSAVSRTVDLAESQAREASQFHWEIPRECDRL
ncbi:hypothetical protein F0562_027966 [Nyssa sinensis]|uniref:Uncharacterized protein n=1 Tax=Nyssa sinensis TaxID=561372 RepID=A0A5J5BAI1_9ASTE|nr:hypothetical protein F0562_027966 [Nyssa sinensis]